MLTKTLVVAVAFATSVFAQAPLVLNTPPEAHQCQPTLITWEGGEPSYFLVFQRDNEVIESFGTLGSNAFNWNTNVPAGSVITLALIDAIQQFVLSAPFTVLQGSSNCTLI
ncbi:hypothetical protein C2E23DRAFT_788722 [Lenzites betulinus]|nr:hypothetical protein C2E23DRAFT_788722 [Lenzites betulinus]